MNPHRRQRQAGIALITVMMISVVFALMLVGFFFIINGEQKISASDRDNTIAFYGAEAGMEKMAADLGTFFAHHTSPTAAQVAALAGPSHEPSIPGVIFPAPGSTDYPAGGYIISFQQNPDGSLKSTSGTIGGTGPLAGLQGLITPFTLTVVAQGPNSTEVKMTRGVQEVSVPVFEFGIFSDTDLSFFAGPDFDFGGRVHTNGDLYLAQGNGGTLKLSDKVTTAKDIIRTQLSNGWPLTSNYNGTVDAITAPGTYRALAMSEGSLNGGPGSGHNPNWPAISLTTYNGNITSSETGGKPLNLDLAVSGNASPIEIIRRPAPGEDPTSVIGQARLLNQANLIILIFDPQTEANTFGSSDPFLSMGVLLDNSSNGFGNGTPESQPGFGPASWYSSASAFDACHPPIAESPGPIPGPYLLAAGTPLLGGLPSGSGFQPARIVILIQNGQGSWTDVTKDVLAQGIAPAPSGCSNHPIVQLEQYAYFGATCSATGCGSNSPDAYIPISLYDAREGELRDMACGSPCNSVALNGVMDVVNLDVKNLQQYFAGAVGTTGSQAIPNGGYIVYFSDRRGNVDSVAGSCSQRYPGAPVASPCSTGEYGNEDIVNPSCGLGTSCLPDGVLEPAEDVNGNGILDTYGATPVWQTSAEQGQWTTFGLPGGASPTPETRVSGGATASWSQSKCSVPSGGGTVACSYPSVPQANPPLFFRRALRLMDGSLGSLPPLATANCSSATGGGFTVVSENPLYVQGDYNATAASAASVPSGTDWPDQPGACHVPASVMADAVTVLSNNWNDSRSFSSPDSPGGRSASTSAYRVGIIAGKNLSFPHPSGTYQDFGTDGGVHNFVRYLESWSGKDYYYRGSLVSLYISRQATGVYKCCTTVYGAPTRAENFDTDFEDISTLPPGTPRFTDINTLSFQQAVLATQ